MKSRKSAVSNSGPLIHLAKAGFLNILKELYSLVVPIEVTVEVVDKGKEKGYADAVQVENAIKSGWIEVVSVQLTREFSEAAEPDLDLAEVKVIYYACKNGITALLDDDAARVFARRFGVEVRGSLGVLIEGMSKGMLSYEEAVSGLNKLSEVMYLSVDVYKTALREIEKRKNTNGDSGMEQTEQGK